jgi:putative transposase
VPTQGWLDLAVVLDLATRRVVGWAMQTTLASLLATDALQMALWRRRPEPGLLHHSDRGVPYACKEYQALLFAHGITPRLSRQGDCWDNAVAESFVATLERELSDDSDWHTRAEAKRALFASMEVWDNRPREGIRASATRARPRMKKHSLFPGEQRKPRVHQSGGAPGCTPPCLPG